jgi:hypothetical protein
VNDSDLESSDFDQALDDAEVACAEEATVVEHAALEEADAAEAFDEEDEEEKPTPKKSKPGLAKPADATEPSAARAGSQVIRRATVRYYDRMNPERAHPLLITITKKMVEKVVKANTNQKSTGPVKVNLAEAVEIEPIIPGCACFPPKITTWLDRKDFVATFYVVPQVLGTIEGAVVLIRQNHVPIAEIRIDGKVVKRTWVVLSGFATICLPFVSAVAKHYQVDFNSQIGDGFNLYLTIIQAVLASLAYVPPWSLLVAFFFLTMLLYWFSRARTKDVFFEVKTVGPQRELARISKLAQSDPDTAAQELLELLRIYPNYQPAHIFYAEWHYKWKSYEHAVDGYEEAFKLKSARAIDYLRASLAASHLGNVEKALEILQLAETLLPDESIPGVMFFNMGCYHAKIGRHAVAVQCLKRALRAGFRKKESYLKDRDLDSLRSRSDFRELLERVKKEKV